jgi:hypothetical protein
MIEAAHLIARYWRTSLADAELGRGAFTREKARGFIQLTPAELHDGRLDQATLKHLFCDQPKDVKSRNVLLRPLAYGQQVSHGRIRAAVPEIVTPLAGPASVSRGGEITPLPGIAAPRDLLEPRASGVTFGSVEAMDNFLSQHPCPLGSDGGGVSWGAYLAYCKDFMAAVFPTLRSDQQFRQMNCGYIEVGDAGKGAGSALISLYDALVADDPTVPLFETVATAPYRPPEPCLPPDAKFAERLGHSSSSYPLAEGQRGVLAHLMATGPGEVLAVNGPPGTGKTTLLLSVVATLWAKAALAGAEPPVIIAASTNNKAVTNVIDAFGKDFSPGEGPFARRWLPDVKSFGSYFPSQSQRQAGAAYQTKDFFDGVEDAAYVDRARQLFLQAGCAAFPDLHEPTLDAVVEALHERLQAQADQLAALETYWMELSQARKNVSALLGDKPGEALADLRRSVEAADADVRATDALVGVWRTYLGDEPILLGLLEWLPPVAVKRLNRARSALTAVWPGAQPEWRRVSDISQAVTTLTQDAGLRREAAKSALELAEAALSAERVCLERWTQALRPLRIESTDAAGWTLKTCDPLADQLIRFPIFLTTTHYWEGRWLQDMDALEDLADEKKRRGRKKLEARWRRRMKLTPCAVSTFHSIPALLEGSRPDSAGRFNKDYLWDFVDLLIVDEAGQAMAEVGGAAFALAKNALVIGDISQLPPIWNIPRQVDQANQLDAKLLTEDDLKRGHDPVTDAGRAAASGSIMRMGQHASRYHQDPDLARGLMLYEHRRCFDEIIAYSNALCYGGKLKPVRGGKRGARGFGVDGLPALGYAHIDGRCELTAGGSRRNPTEAKAIAVWLREQRGALEAAYSGYPLGKIVGVVAPFTGQVGAIREALSAEGIPTGEPGGIVVGSVHTFQGAERPVVIFSPTYSKHADGGFIDRDLSLLNVAVSRAQNSFLTFGDMDLLSAASGASPRGLLGRLLFADEANRLPFQPLLPRPDLVGDIAVQILRDAAQHDAFLSQVLADAQREVHIVAPWVGQRVIDQADLRAAIIGAAQRGVVITIYTNPEFNADRAAQNGAKREDCAAHLESLREMGAEAVEVARIHSKIVMADDQLYCVGSFNWLSSARTGRYAYQETSMVYRSREATGEIALTKADLRRRRRLVAD